MEGAANTTTDPAITSVSSDYGRKIEERGQSRVWLCPSGSSTRAVYSVKQREAIAAPDLTDRAFRRRFAR